MNNITEVEIIQFLREETYEEVIRSETDIFSECGISGYSHELIDFLFNPRENLNLKVLSMKKFVVS